MDLKQNATWDRLKTFRSQPFLHWTIEGLKTHFKCSMAQNISLYGPSLANKKSLQCDLGSHCIFRGLCKLTVSKQL